VARRRRKAHEEEHEEEGGQERWLVSYADMITLLAALFIVLFAMSSLDLAKFQRFAAALKVDLGGASNAGALGPGPKVNPDGLDPKKVPRSGAGDARDAADAATKEAERRALAEKQAAERARSAERDRLQQVEAEIRRQLAAVGLERSVKFRFEARGLVVQVVTDEVLFDTGSDILRPDGRRVLDGLAPALLKLPNEVSIEGHTDDRPITGRFASNWELSTARATSVLRYLIDVHGFPPKRVMASGYADQRPLAPNDGDPGRSLNRRVEVVILSQVG